MRKLAFKSRIPKNGPENRFVKRFTSRGWKITKRGWPDFFCFKDGKIMLVEVKPLGGRLKPAQRLIAKKLAKFGVPVYVYQPKIGLMRVSSTLI